MSTDYSTAKCKSYMADRESLRCARVFCWCTCMHEASSQHEQRSCMRLFMTDTVFGIYGARCKSILSSFLQVSGLSAGETTLPRVSREALLENGAVLWWAKAHIIFLIKEWSAEAQRQNSSHRKVTCNDDPSWWIWGLSFQYPVPWLMQGHIYLKMLRLPYNKIPHASGCSSIIISILSIWTTEFLLLRAN